jgi:diguanylate cyclase (GGDEF)-like protein
MSQVVEHLAELTGFRDRDVLDVTLVGALKDLLRPDVVAIYRCVGQGDDRRWLTRARLEAGESTASADPLWAELDSLPRLDSNAARLACFLCQEPMTAGTRPAISMFPLATDRDVIGVLEVATEQPLDAEQTRMVSSILRVYRNFQGLLDYSERDTLTGLLNRKTFDEAFMRTAAAPQVPLPAIVNSGGLRRMPSDGSPWLGIIDIDHFKRVNDNHGHSAGDHVLRHVVDTAKAQLRASDFLARIGGEEFVLLLPGQDQAASAQVAERIRAALAAAPVHTPCGHVIDISSSFGVGELGQHEQLETALCAADKSLYSAKQGGRNRVALASGC